MPHDNFKLIEENNSGYYVIPYVTNYVYDKDGNEYIEYTKTMRVYKKLVKGHLCFVKEEGWNAPMYYPITLLDFQKYDKYYFYGDAYNLRFVDFHTNLVHEISVLDMLYWIYQNRDKYQYDNKFYADMATGCFKGKTAWYDESLDFIFDSFLEDSEDEYDSYIHKDFIKSYKEPVIPDFPEDYYDNLE